MASTQPSTPSTTAPTVPITSLATTKKTKIKRALKSAALLPVRVPYLKARRGMGKNSFAPKAGEPPVVILRVQVLGCMNLPVKDRSGTSDPFITVHVLNSRQQTPVVKRSLNPVYAAKDATFDFPLYLSLADKLGGVELVAWDKDVIKKDYLGEVSFPLEDWFVDRSDGKDRPYGFEEVGNQPFSLNLISTRANTPAMGSVQLKLGFVATSNAMNLMEFDEIFSEFVKRSRTSLVSAPPTEGVGTIRSHHTAGFNFEDDGGLSSDPDDTEDETDEPETILTAEPLSLPSVSTSTSYISKPPDLVINETSPSTPTPGNLPTPLAVQPTPKASAGFGFNPKNFVRKLSGFSSTSSNAPLSPALASPAIDTQGNLVVPSPVTPGGETGPRKKFAKRWNSSSRPPSPSLSAGETAPSPPKEKKRRGKAEYSLGGENDIVGIVMLEIQRAEDLPKLKNMTRTGWDMDPFVVISFGKKVFRTRVIRHSLNPVWDEKLLFHVRRYETSFKVQLTILDWDKLSANDLIGETGFDLKDLLDHAPQPDSTTGLYGAENDSGDHPMKEYKLHLTPEKGMTWESKFSPVITFRAKYQPYDALRQHFWRIYLKQYDTDDTNTMSHLELTSMLDSLGSTLTTSTISSFFTRFGEKSSGELTIDQAIQCLETELNRPDSEKKTLDSEEAHESSISATPVLLLSGQMGQELNLDKLDFSGPPTVHDSTNADAGGTSAVTKPHRKDSSQQALSDSAELSSTDDEDVEVEEVLCSASPSPASTPSETPAELSTTPPKKKRNLRFKRNKKPKPTKEGSVSNNSGGDESPSSSDNLERVINIKNCPLCHRPRLNSKAEMDIITHLAVCASQDWNKVDRIVVGNFVTASQAQRKWYTKVISKVSSGDYKLGANSANIIVQNRMTGKLEEEKMQVYVRLGIRLLYKGATSRMEGGRARRLLKSLSIKQGLKYDAPESAHDIPGFIAFHNLNKDEILDPLESFKTFNEFFYRKLKASARPLESPEDPYRLVSAADCRLMAFETVSEATRLWIKGREFTVARLLGDAYMDEAHKFIGGALVIFRLAPQDYHRFHSPVEGRVGTMTYIAGEYYTVNPQAIRSALDVYGENARKIVPIDSPHFGRVMAVCIGAMMVGSIQTTVQEGEYIQRGQEFGYFAFGGSTIVILFEKDRVKWDEDLLINGRAALETLVRVGMGIGKGQPR